MKFSKLNVSLIAALAFAFSANAQGNYTAKKGQLSETDLQRWSHLDMVKDSVPGMSVDKAYSEFLKGKKGQKVIVGVVDSGVDIEHEDLKSVIWTNKKEIPGNGIDDDKNGYIDDVHGWNFLGDATDENLELVRIVKKGDDGSADYKRALEAFKKKAENAAQDKMQVDFIANVDAALREHLKKDTYTLEDLNAISSTDAKINEAKMIMTTVLTQVGPDLKGFLTEYKEHVDGQVKYNLNKDFDGRKVVGDNPDDIKDVKYGNNIVFGPDKKDALHGTHVAGIIAQSRQNGIGGDGVADNVEIMAIRAVPNGDEYDKDIALAIRYAVDNGAKVINGSFGKDFSPHKEWVWDAIKYAEKKDVLIVFAAGNDGKDLDVEPSFPTDSPDKNSEIAKNVLTIGALNYEYGTGLVAPFSNFGMKMVDVYAPGMKIYATVPNNKYLYEQGTSMASPNAAGVAALVRSYYPTLTAAQVKKIIMDSGMKIDLTVGLGNSGIEKPFSQASVSGKIVNAYNALVMAEKMSKQKTKTVKG